GEGEPSWWGRMQLHLEVLVQVARRIGQEAMSTQIFDKLSDSIEVHAAELVHVLDHQVAEPSGAVHPLREEVVFLAKAEIVGSRFVDHGVRRALPGAKPDPAETVTQFRTVVREANPLGELVPDRPPPCPTRRALHRRDRVAGAHREKFSLRLLTTMPSG